MTRAPLHTRVRPADLRRRARAVQAVTRLPTLTSGNTRHSTRAENTEASTPWGPRRAPNASTVTSSAGMNPASGSPAGSSRRAAGTATTRATPAATAKATQRVTAKASRTGRPLARCHTSELAGRAAAVPAAHSGGSVKGAALVVLVALIAAVVWLGSLYVHPFTRCSTCKGSGVTKRSTGKRFGLCKACGGTRRRQRFGSRALHRAVQSARSEYQRERARRAEARVTERTRNPRNHGGAR